MRNPNRLGYRGSETEGSFASLILLGHRTSKSVDLGFGNSNRTYPYQHCATPTPMFGGHANPSIPPPLFATRSPGWIVMVCQRLLTALSSPLVRRNRCRRQTVGSHFECRATADLGRCQPCVSDGEAIWRERKIPAQGNWGPIALALTWAH